MKRLSSILILALLTGCASQMLDPERQTQLATQRAMQKFDQDRLLDYYRKAFTRGFLDPWEGTDHSPGDNFSVSDDPDRDAAMDRGYYDGLRAGRRARVDYEDKKAEKKH